MERIKGYLEEGLAECRSAIPSAKGNWLFFLQGQLKAYQEALSYINHLKN